MRSVKVDIYTLSGGASFTFDDSVSPNAGSTAYTQLRNDEDVDSIFDDDGLVEVYIPLHSIAAAYVTYEEVDDPSDNICEEGPSIDCTRVGWIESNDGGDSFGPISDGDTFQKPVHSVSYLYACMLDGTTLVQPTYTCDLPGATFTWNNDEYWLTTTQTGTAHITLDYMGCKISFTVEVV